MPIYAKDAALQIFSAKHVVFYCVVCTANSEGIYCKLHVGSHVLMLVQPHAFGCNVYRETCLQSVVGERLW